jgi:hypothetical protein
VQDRIPEEILEELQLATTIETSRKKKEKKRKKNKKWMQRVKAEERARREQEPNRSGYAHDNYGDEYYNNNNSNNGGGKFSRANVGVIATCVAMAAVIAYVLIRRV